MNSSSVLLLGNVWERANSVLGGNLVIVSATDYFVWCPLVRVNALSGRLHMLIIYLRVSLRDS